MLQKKYIVFFSIMASGTILIAAGCATVDYVDEQVGLVKQSVGKVEALANQNKAKIDDLSKGLDAQKQVTAKLGSDVAAAKSTADSAMAEAKKASELAAKPKELVTTSVLTGAVHFDFNKAVLTKEGKKALDDLAAKIKENKNYTVAIEGHTDSIGSDRYNLGLGEQRAKTVLRYLVGEKGINPFWINVISFGEGKPVADNKTKKGRADNRRAGIAVYSIVIK